MTFVYISLNMVIGVGLFLESLIYIDVRQNVLVVILVFGGVIPTVMNLKVEYWMKNQCKIKNYITVPTGAEYIVDWVNFLLVAAGFAV